MAKVKIDWHSKPASDYQKDVVLERFRRYLRSIGLHDETIKLYVGEFELSWISLIAEIQILPRPINTVIR